MNSDSFLFLSVDRTTTERSSGMRRGFLSRMTEESGQIFKSVLLAFRELSASSDGGVSGEPSWRMDGLHHGSPSRQFLGPTILQYSSQEWKDL